MDDEQIEILKQLLTAGQRLAWKNGQEYREILEICMRKEAHEDDDGLEPAGVFYNGEYIALYNAEPTEIMLFNVTPVFEFDAEENG